MIKIPIPDYMTLTQWTNDLIRQDGSIPRLHMSWKSWAESLNLTSKYRYVGTAGYETWQDWARSFLTVNQGV